MAPPSFVHLHCHTEYSLLDGANRVDRLVAAAKQMGMNALAITDHGNLFGAVKFYRAASEAGIKPIIGYEAYVAPGDRRDRDRKGIGDAAYHLTLLARNKKGLRNLVRMSSLAYLEGFYYRPRVDKELLQEMSEGLICLSGCLSSELNTLLSREEMDEAADLVRWYQDVFGEGHVYIELQDNGLAEQEQCNARAIEIATKLGVPLVATCDVHYLSEADAAAHDVLLCINTGKLRSDPNRLRYGSTKFYLQSPEEMWLHFRDCEEAVRNTQRIADACNVAIDFSTRHFPPFSAPDGLSNDAYLRRLCDQGLRERYGDSPSAEALARLDHELAVISKTGFSGYFLIVWDFVRFSKEQGIPCGARGSGCGALVSYVLGISHVDPLEYDLLFERFLDESRNEAPDIDIDFCQDGRAKIIEYVRDKYGADSVAQVITFGTMAARAVIRDVGRVLDLPLPRVDAIAKLIPTVLKITLDDALQQSPELRDQYETDVEVRELIDIGRSLEGLARHASTHAAAVVIADKPLTEYVPLQKNGEDVTTQWAWEDVDEIGLLKMDFLGLRTLTTLDKAVALVRETQGAEVDLNKLPPDDAATYALLQRGDTKGVFQLESSGIRDLLQKMKPDCFRDIVATNALYRPGPLGGGMVEDYIARKHGRATATYEHPAMEEILDETHGVMVYQEQVMRILNRLGDIELTRAYTLIKAIGKKHQDVIDAEREAFITGCKTRGVTQATAEKIFELITHFGGYGFNKSHSAAYAMVAYQTAYMKAHYPTEFMAALLTCEMVSTTKTVEYIEECRRMGVEVLPPDVNQSEADFTVADGTIRFGLAAVKGVGHKAIEAVSEERRRGGPFTSLFDFCERVDPRHANKTVVEHLIKCGAVDGLCPNRARLFAAVEKAMQAGASAMSDRRAGQRSLFESLPSQEDVDPLADLPDVPPWPEPGLLAFEKEVLGFYVSSHPLARHSDVIRQFSSTASTALSDLADGAEVILGGMITGLRLTQAKRASKNGGHTRMAIFSLEDLDGQADCVIFPDGYARFKQHITDDNIVFVKGRVDLRREQPSVRVAEISPLDQAQEKYTQRVIIQVNCAGTQEKDLDVLLEIMRHHAGDRPVYLELETPSHTRIIMRVDESLRVRSDGEFSRAVQEVLGEGHVRFVGAGRAAVRAPGPPRLATDAASTGAGPNGLAATPLHKETR